MDLSVLWRYPMRMVKLKFEKVDHFREQKYEKIKKQLISQKSIFTDLTFPASPLSLGVNSSNTSSAIEWKRPKDLVSSPKLFDHKDSPHKIEAGQLSSNWLVSAFKILSGVRILRYRIVINYHEQEWDEKDEQKNVGIFHFRFWRFGKWIEVVVDDLLPTIDKKLLFTHTSSENEFWVSLLEKAYAKLCGTYDALEEGHVSDALVDMTGGASEIIDLKSGVYANDESRRGDLLNLLVTEIGEHSIICASVVAHSRNEVGKRTELGLICGQAYQITSVKKIHLGELKLRNLFRGRERVAVVRLKDTGAVNIPEDTRTKNVINKQETDSYAYSTPRLTRLLSKNSDWIKMKESEKRNLGLAIEQEGEFWMPFEDFVSNMEELTIIRLFNSNIFARGKFWRVSTVEGKWVVKDKSSWNDRSGGGNINSDTFFKNPQYLLEVLDEEEEISLQMLQWEGVEPVTPSSPSQNVRPYHGSLLIGFTIIKVEVNRKYRLHKLIPFSQVLVSVDHQRKRELFYRGFFPKGKYVLVPTTFKQGAEGNFLIRIFSQGHVKFREICRDLPRGIHPLSSCLSKPVVWITVIALRGAAGLGITKNAYCIIKCEKKKVRSQIGRFHKEIEWNDVFIFYRKHTHRPIVLKVYIRHALKKNTLIGSSEFLAEVNHSPTPLEVTLRRKDDKAIENAIIKLEVLTEDNPVAI